MSKNSMMFENTYISSRTEEESRVLFENNNKNAKKDLITFFVLCMIIFFLSYMLVNSMKIGTLMMEYSIGEFFIVFLAFLGLKLNNQYLHGLGIVGILPSFLIGTINSLNSNILTTIPDLFGLVLGTYIFLKKDFNNTKPLFLSALFYLNIRIFVSFKVLSLTPAINGDFRFVSLFFIIITPFLMPIFTHFKSQDNKFLYTKIFESQISKSKFEIYLELKIDDTKKLRKHYFYALVIGGIISGLIKYNLSGSYINLITVSNWTFVIMIFMMFFTSSFYSSWVFSISPLMIFLMFSDYIFIELNADAVVNWLYHGIMVVLGIIYFIKKRVVRWDYVFTMGLILSYYGYYINYYHPGYLGRESLMAVYFIIIETIIISALIYWRSWKNYKENERNEDKINYLME